MKLYHYYHCPFCVRVRLALGFLGLAYESKPVDYDDEKTPVELTGKKMLPILVDSDGAHNESLDIIERLDVENKSGVKDFLGSKKEKELEDFLGKLAKEVHNLAMPYWIYTKEFTKSARSYFQEKKEKKRGPFSGLVANQEEYIKNLHPLLLELEEKLTPYYQSDKIAIEDILIASHLWGMYVVPEFQFSPKVHQYLQSIKKRCDFDYMGELWSS